MPIKLINVEFGQKRLIPNEALLGAFLKISNFETRRLTNLFIKEKFVAPKKDKINYTVLKLEYKKYIDDRVVKNQAELARRFKVSRAWITKVFNRG